MWVNDWSFTYELTSCLQFVCVLGATSGEQLAYQEKKVHNVAIANALQVDAAR